jgi:Mn2+/Fe2+ NRAMP family transporter
LSENYKKAKFKDLFFGRSYLGDLGRALLLWVLFIVSMFMSFSIVTSSPLAPGTGGAIGFLFIFILMFSVFIPIIYFLLLAVARANRNRDQISKFFKVLSIVFISCSFLVGNSFMLSGL